MDRESPELIEQEMEHTRAALTEKVTALEQQVIGTIHDASQAVTNTVASVRNAVQDTLHSVKDTVSESVHTVTDTMKQSLDLPGHTRRHPWAMVGGATALGFLTGLVIFSRRDRSIMAQGSWEGVPVFSPDSTTNGRTSTPYQGATVTAPRVSSWVDELMDRIGREAIKLGETTLATATESLRQSVEAELPKLIGEGIPRLIGTHLSSPVTGSPTLQDTCQTTSSYSERPDSERPAVR